MKLSVKNLQNQQIREIELPDEIFAYPFKEHLIHTVVRANRAAKRAGTHKTKVRGEVSGTGRKLWKQKGTGRARMGSLRSPLWRKGGTVHGPKVRSHALDVTVGEKKNALKSVLSRKLADQQLLVLDNFDLPSAKTKNLDTTLTVLGIERKALLVDTRENESLLLASRNNPRLKTVDPRGVQVYDLVDRDHVIFSEAALQTLVEVLKS